MSFRSVIHDFVLKTRSWNPDRLRLARLEAGFSQEGLAERLTELMQREAKPIRTRSIVRWERPRGTNGAHVPHSDFVATIAEATGREIEFFFNEDDATDVEDEEAARMRSASEAEFLEALRPLARLFATRESQPLKERVATRDLHTFADAQGEVAGE